jgi:zinc transporter, ZIP family
VDGIPESVIFGIQIAAGQPLSVTFLAAVWVSNIPQALAPSADLSRSGWHAGRLVTMWAVVVAACAVTAGLGYLLADATGATGGRAAAFAGGGMLAMLTDSLMPYAFQRGGRQAGVWTVVEFAQRWRRHDPDQQPQDQDESIGRTRCLAKARARPG